MGRNYADSRDRGTGSGRKETEIPPLEVIEKIIQRDEPEMLVKYAEQIGEGLAQNERLTTSQIRSIFSEVKQVEGLIQAGKRMGGPVQENSELKLPRQAKRRLILLKPKIAYQARRQMESHKGPGIAKLEKVLAPAIDLIGENVQYFRRFMDFFEAILAYHKSAGGREQ